MTDPLRTHTRTRAELVSTGEDTNYMYEYRVEADGMEYILRGVDAWDAEQRARKLFRNKFGFSALRVVAKFLPQSVTK